MGSLGNSLGKESINPLYQPDYRNLSQFKVEIFRKAVSQKFGVKLENYHDLHDWSVRNREKFWAEVWDFSGIIHSQSYTSVVDESLSIDCVPKWFEGARLNYAENLLEKGNDNDIAVYYKGEGHPKLEKLTFAQLRVEVAAWASALKNSGIGIGDVVAGILPNSPQCLAAVLATSSLGAVWTSCSPDYGTIGVVERFKQTEPKVIICANAVFYNGKIHSLTEKLEQILLEITTIKKAIVVPFIENAPIRNPNSGDSSNLLSSNDFLKEYRSAKISNNYEQLPFDHPLFIMYSSGTTGKPKCMVHSQGGTLIKHVEEHLLQSDLRRNDTIFYYTTVGWMMYNWLISALFAGSSLVLYDGAPTAALWDLIDELGITIFGTSAKWIAVQEDLHNKGQPSVAQYPLNKENTPLRMLLSTGSPLKPQSFDFIYNKVKKNVLLGSISGGTDIIGCFMGQNVVLPVYRGEIQSYHLGCDLDCLDEGGNSIIGERGELCVLSAFPSMPTHFYNDFENLLYKKAYFAKFNSIWAHGDYMLVNAFTKGIVMLGRSDATLNPNGVRFGSAEIYQVVEQFIEICDSVCVAQRNISRTEERVVLFLKLSPGFQYNDDLVTRIKKSIRENLSPRHVPAVILSIQEIPYTMTGKKVEIAVRNVIEGEEVKNSGALSNPASLKLYERIPQLQSWS